MSWQVVLILISTLASLIASLVSGLVVYTFKSIISKVEKLDTRIGGVEDRYAEAAKAMSACKIDCSREFVSSESFVRSEAYNRVKIDQIADALNKLVGEMKFVNNMPEVSGEIAARVAEKIIISLRSSK